MIVWISVTLAAIALVLNAALVAVLLRSHRRERIEHGELLLYIEEQVRTVRHLVKEIKATLTLLGRVP